MEIRHLPKAILHLLIRLSTLPDGGHPREDHLSFDFAETLLPNHPDIILGGSKTNVRFREPLPWVSLRPVQHSGIEAHKSSSTATRGSHVTDLFLLDQLLQKRLLA